MVMVTNGVLPSLCLPKNKNQSTKYTKSTKKYHGTGPVASVLKTILE